MLRRKYFFIILTNKQINRSVCNKSVCMCNCKYKRPINMVGFFTLTMTLIWFRPIYDKIESIDKKLDALTQNKN